MMIEPIAPKPSFPNAFMAVMVGYLANLALPRLGEFARCGIISRYADVPPAKAVGTVLTERAIDLVFLFFVTAFALFMQYQISGKYFEQNIWEPMKNRYLALFSGNQLYSNIVLLGSILIISVLTWWLTRRFKQLAIYQKVAGMAAGMWHGIVSVRRVKNIPLFLFHSLLIWVMYFAMIYVCFFSTEATQQLDWRAGIAVLAFGTFGIIATQGGIGAYQIVVTGLLMLYNIPKDLAYAFSWLVWSAQTLLILIGGLIAMIALPIYNHKSVSMQDAFSAVEDLNIDEIDKANIEDLDKSV